MKISVIIVNYNSGALTQSCIESIMSQAAGKRVEFIVVDNASTDNSVSFLRSDLPEITVIANKVNRGFAHGVNQGITQAKGDYYLVLNPDIIALPNSVSALVEFMQSNPEIGIAGGQLLSPNGSIQNSCYRFYTPLTVIYRRTWLGRSRAGRQHIKRFLMKDFDHARVQDVDWLMGSCLCARASAVKQVGGMDERFFLYFEDVDWCRRFWQGGWRVTYVPQARFSHFHQQSSRKGALFGILTNWTTREHIRSAIKYFRKYHHAPSPRIG